jgi:mono/diheme cytochrome c family protein
MSFLTAGRFSVFKDLDPFAAPIDTRPMRCAPAAAISLAMGLAAAAVLAGCGSGGSKGSNPSDPHVAMGAHVFVQFACSSCHGEQGKGDVSPDVPR